MNLAAYDDIKPKIDKQKTWVDIDKKLLYSREITYRPYVLLSKRYNKELAEYEYFVIMLDEKPINKISANTNRDDYGRIKIRLMNVFIESSLATLEHSQNINIELVDHADDGDIYKLDI